MRKHLFLNIQNLNRVPTVFFFFFFKKPVMKLSETLKEKKKKPMASLQNWSEQNSK